VRTPRPPTIVVPQIASDGFQRCRELLAGDALPETHAEWEQHTRALAAEGKAARRRVVRAEVTPDDIRRYMEMHGLRTMSYADLERLTVAKARDSSRRSNSRRRAGLVSSD